MTTTNGTTSLRAAAGEPEARPDAPWAPVPFSVLGGTEHRGSRGVLTTLCRLSAFARPGKSGARQVRFRRWTAAAELLGVHTDTLRRHLARLVEVGAIVLSGRTIGFLAPHFLRLPLALLDAPWCAIVAWAALWKAMPWQGSEALQLRVEGLSELYRLAGGDRRQGDRRHGEAGLTWLRANGWVAVELGFPIVVRLVPAGPESGPAENAPHPVRMKPSSPGASSPLPSQDLFHQQEMVLEEEPPKRPAKKRRRKKRNLGREGHPDVIAVWKAFRDAGAEVGANLDEDPSQADAGLLWEALIKYGRPQCTDAVRGVWKLSWVIQRGEVAQLHWAFKRSKPNKGGTRTFEFSLDRVRECVERLNPDRKHGARTQNEQRGCKGAGVSARAHVYEPAEDGAPPMIVVETKAPTPAATIPAEAFGRAVELSGRKREIAEAEQRHKVLFNQAETWELLRVAIALGGRP